MAIDVKTILCQQCGSADVCMISETQGECKSCGAKFTVQPRIETQNVYNEVHLHAGEEPKEEKESSCSKYLINPDFSTDDFIREAWIKLAREDVPLDVFKQNFGEISRTEHQVVMDSVSVNMSYQASIGYDRQEPYTAYEDYKEQVLDHYEYVNNQEKAVYKTVTKQRPVTKYKTVTDWSAQRGEHSAESFVTVENLPGQQFDENSFMNSFKHLSTSSLSLPSKDMQVTSATHKEVMSEHSKNLYADLYASLPGDHHKDIDYQITDIVESHTALYSCQEYKATIAYKGKAYSKHAFPFGKMCVAGDSISNDESVASISRKKRDAIPSMIWKKTMVLSVLTLCILALSIVISVAIRNTSLVVIAFIAAVCLFVCNIITEKVQTKKITKKVEAEIDDYTNIHCVELLEVLNGKLKSLGYEPATEDEF